MSFNIDKMISPFIKALPPSGLAKFLEITANNPNIVPLSVGEPDFDIPAKVRAACIDSLNAGKSNYTSTLGMLELREALVALRGPMGNMPAFRAQLQALLADEKSREQLIAELGLAGRK